MVLYGIRSVGYVPSWTWQETTKFQLHIITTHQIPGAGTPAACHSRPPLWWPQWPWRTWGWAAVRFLHSWSTVIVGRTEGPGAIKTQFNARKMSPTRGILFLLLCLYGCPESPLKKVMAIRAKLENWVIKRVIARIAAFRWSRRCHKWNPEVLLIFKMVSHV